MAAMAEASSLSAVPGTTTLIGSCEDAREEKGRERWMRPKDSLLDKLTRARRTWTLGPAPPPPPPRGSSLPSKRLLIEPARQPELPPPPPPFEWPPSGRPAGPPAAVPPAVTMYDWAFPRPGRAGGKRRARTDVERGTIAWSCVYSIKMGPGQQFENRRRPTRKGGRLVACAQLTTRRVPGPAPRTQTRAERKARERTLFGVGVVDGKVKVASLAHLVLHNDLLLEVPDRDASAIERDPAGLLLRLELVEHEARHGGWARRLGMGMGQRVK